MKATRTVDKLIKFIKLKCKKVLFLLCYKIRTISLVNICQKNKGELLCKSGSHFLSLNASGNIVFFTPRIKSLNTAEADRPLNGIQPQPLSIPQLIRSLQQSALFLLLIVILPQITSQANLLVNTTSSPPCVNNEIIYISGVSNTGAVNRYFIPLALRTWSPFPNTPYLIYIDNEDQDNYYTIYWQDTKVGVSYILEEDVDASFLNPLVVYQGSELSWSVQAPGKYPGTYYYRIKATNVFGESSWSNIQMITIYPLYVGMKVRWDGAGFIRGYEYYDIGTHLERNLDILTDPDTIRSNNKFWYDPNPFGWESEYWVEYYSVTTGQWRGSDYISDPSWKWGYPWKLGYSANFESGETVSIDNETFTVTGPHAGYTTYGKLIYYWEFINQDKFLFWDDGSDWKQYVHPGDAILRYDAGNSRLLIYSSILRHFYYQGEIISLTVQYIDNLTSSSSLPGSPMTLILSMPDETSAPDAAPLLQEKYFYGQPH